MFLYAFRLLYEKVNRSAFSLLTVRPGGGAVVAWKCFAALLGIYLELEVTLNPRQHASIQLSG